MRTVRPVTLLAHLGVSGAAIAAAVVVFAIAAGIVGFGWHASAPPPPPSKPITVADAPAAEQGPGARGSGAGRLPERERAAADRPVASPAEVARPEVGPGPDPPWGEPRPPEPPPPPPPPPPPVSAEVDKGPSDLVTKTTRAVIGTARSTTEALSAVAAVAEPAVALTADTVDDAGRMVDVALDRVLG